MSLLTTYTAVNTIARLRCALFAGVKAASPIAGKARWTRYKRLQFQVMAPMKSTSNYIIEAKVKSVCKILNFNSLQCLLPRVSDDCRLAYLIQILVPKDEHQNGDVTVRPKLFSRGPLCSGPEPSSAADQNFSASAFVEGSGTRARDRR